MKLGNSISRVLYDSVEELLYDPVWNFIYVSSGDSLRDLILILTQRTVSSSISNTYIEIVIRTRL